MLGQFQAYAFEKSNSLCSYRNQLLCKKSDYFETGMPNQPLGKRKKSDSEREKGGGGDRNRGTEGVRDRPYGVAPRH